MVLEIVEIVGSSDNIVVQVHVEQTDRRKGLICGAGGFIFSAEQPSMIGDSDGVIR